MSSARENIEETVESQEGIGFSQLKREVGVENGVLQYHLQKSDKLEKRNGAILPAGFCRECILRENCTDNCHRKLLRQPLKKSIVENLDAGKTQAEIARELGKDGSTISYHVQQLGEEGILKDKVPVQPVKKFLGLE